MCRVYRTKANKPYKIHYVVCKMNSAHSEVYSVQCTLYSEQCTVNSAHYKVYTLQCTVYNEQCTL